MRALIPKADKRREIQLLINHISSQLHAVPACRCVHSHSRSRTVSFLLISKNQPGLGVFFYEMINRSFPGTVSFFFHARGQDNLFFAEIEMVFSNDEEWGLLKKRFPLVRDEILLGARSAYYASRILECKGMSVEKKRMNIQARVAKMIRRFPKLFDYDFFALVQHYFLSVHPENLHFHEARQMGENMAILYRLRKQLIVEIDKSPNKRHLLIKVKKRHIHLLIGSKRVLGVWVGLNFLHEHECFNEKHLIRAIRAVIPGVDPFKETAYRYEDVDHFAVFLYLEVDSDQQRLLQKELALALKGRIEHLQRSLFMPRNEEEIMRDLITLSSQLKLLQDLPQVILSFHRQTEERLFFIVVLARILLPNSPPWQQLFKGLFYLKPQIERVRKMGEIRKKYPKEGLVFKVELSTSQCFREDQSIDLYKARLLVLKQLQNGLGEVRDYNGGMLSKQSEVLSSLTTLLGETAEKNKILLDHFFHALFPLEKRGLCSPVRLKTLFELLLKVFLESKPFLTADTDAFYLVMETHGWAKLAQMKTLLSHVQFTFLRLTYDQRSFFGLIVQELSHAEKKEVLDVCHSTDQTKSRF